ncbi:MAG: alkaline phosphatase family protein [Candidatus Dormibacteria bacterium]
MWRGAPSRGLSRRDFLRGSAVAGTAAVFAPGLLTNGAQAVNCLLPPGSLPFPGRPAGIPQPDLAPELSNIDHVFVLMQENKSFDAYFGMLPWDPVTRGRLHGRVDGWRGLDGAGRPTDVQQDKDGKWYQAFQMRSSCATSKPDVSWDYSHHAYNGGKMDQFVGYHSGEAAMGYWNHEVLSTYYSLAAHFPVGDRYFSSVLGSTDPNRLFSICASAVGITDTMRPPPPNFDPNNPAHQTQVSPPNGHIFEVLDHYSVPWLTIAGNLPTVGLIAAPYAESRVGRNIILAGSNENAVTALQAVITAGTLPRGVITVEPDFVYGSEENANDIDVGQHFIEGVVKAIMGNAAVWSRSLILFAYDESGGYYDHVTPPAAITPGDGVPPHLPRAGWFGDNYQRYGFRVPNMVISPWARADHVSHVVRDHTSILRTIQAKWNLPALTYRDANAADFRECLVASGPAPFEVPPPVAAAPAKTALDSIQCQQQPALAGTFPGSVPRPRVVPGPTPPPAVSYPAACPTPQALTASPAGAGGGGAGGTPNTGTVDISAAAVGLLGAAALGAAVLGWRRRESPSTRDGRPENIGLTTPGGL